MEQIQLKPVTKRNNCISEYQECKAYWDWAQYHPPIGKYLIKHCNENKNPIWFNQYLLRIGMRPGLPDYQFPIPNEKWSGLWIEMKRKGGKVQNNQIRWINDLKAINHYATVAYGAEDAIRITLDYINNRI